MFKHLSFDEPYQLVLPLNLAGWVPEGAFVRLLVHELKNLNYSLLCQAYCIRLTPPKEKVFIAGTNLEAYANKYTFVWKKHSLKQDISKREIWDMIKQQALIYAMPEKRESHCP